MTREEKFILADILLGRVTEDTIEDANLVNDPVCEAVLFIAGANPDSIESVADDALRSLVAQLERGQ